MLGWDYIALWKEKEMLFISLSSFKVLAAE